MIVTPLPFTLPTAMVTALPDDICIIPKPEPTVCWKPGLTGQQDTGATATSRALAGERNCWDPRTWGGVQGAADGITIQLPSPDSPIQ